MDQEEIKSSSRERLFHRLKYSYRYLDLFSSNLRKMLPIFFSSRRKRAAALRFPAQIGRPFAISLPEREWNGEKIHPVLAELDVDLVRFSISSDQISELGQARELAACLQQNGVKSVVSLVQRREDVSHPDLWRAFIAEAISGLGGICPFFEVGQAWNLPGSGVHDYQEYLNLAHAVFSADEDRSLALVGPAAAGFRFSLYPPILKVLPFEGVSCQLDIPSETDLTRPVIGKDFVKKLAHLQAVIEVSSQRGKGLWLTDLGWPVPEEETDADTLVRFLVPTLATGLVEKVFLPWHTVRFSSVLKTMMSFLIDSIFEGKFVHQETEIFMFCKAKEVYAVAWTDGRSVDYEFPAKLKKTVSRDGEAMPAASQLVRLDSQPRYVVFEND